MASHAGTTPMDRRRDAAAAVAELALYVEQRAAQDGDSVGTIGMLQVPNGSINVVPGPLPVHARPARAQRRAARRAGRRRAGRAGGDLRAPRPALHARGNHARRRRAQRTRLAAALGARGRRAGRAAAPHAQRRRPRRHEAARGDAAGDAVRARPATPASATTRWRARTSDDIELAVRAFQHLLRQLATNIATMTALRATRRLDRRPLRRGSALPAGAGARAHRHAARQQRAARRAHRRTAGRLRLRGREARRCPQAEVQAYGLRVDHQPDRAPPLRRRRRRRSRSTPTATWCRPAKAGRTTPTAARSTDGRLYGRAAAVSKSDFASFTFAVRALEALARAARRAASNCTSPTTRSSAASSGPGWLLQHRA